LNDYRNRVELPTLGVFLQPDPIGFKGDAANLYRFVNNNAVNRIDPLGLRAQFGPIQADWWWRTACYFDSGNSFQGSLLDFFKDRWPAGMDGGSEGGGSADRPGDGGGSASGPSQAFSSRRSAPPLEQAQAEEDFPTWQGAGLAGGRKAYTRVDKSGLGGDGSYEYGGAILKRTIRGRTVYNYNGPFQGSQGAVKDRYRNMPRANYLDVMNLPIPNGWEKAGWYYAHPIHGNLIPDDDKAVARDHNWVAVGLAPPIRGSPGYHPGQPLIEFYPK
jgi:uncharacterized protein RhaS with RHS repeats